MNKKNNGLYLSISQNNSSFDAILNIQLVVEKIRSFVMSHNK